MGEFDNLKSIVYKQIHMEMITKGYIRGTSKSNYLLHEYWIPVASEWKQTESFLTWDILQCYCNVLHNQIYYEIYEVHTAFSTVYTKGCLDFNGYVRLPLKCSNPCRSVPIHPGPYGVKRYIWNQTSHKYQL